jgi:hypothetical protein
MLKLIFNNAMADNNYGEIEPDNDTPYDPMSFAADGNEVVEPLQPSKRFKMSENAELDFNSQSSAPVNDISNMVELDDSNSIKLKKGNLVIRKYNDQDGDMQVSQLCNDGGFTVINPKTLAFKSVKYMPDDAIEMVKFFEKNAEPSAPALTIDQVMEVQKNLENQTNGATEDSKIDHKYSHELDKRDGIDKDKKKVLENMKKVPISPHSINCTLC